MRKLAMALLLLGACTHDTSALRGDDGGSDGAMDSGAVDSGVVDSGRMDAADDTGTADTGTADTGTADTGTADTGTADTGMADTGTADTGVADAGCMMVLHQSAELTPDDDLGLFMNTGDLHGWWFHVDAPFVPTEIGAGVRVRDADASLRLAIVPVAGLGTFPADDVPTDAVITGSVTAPANGGVPQDASAALTGAPTLAAGWYALTVKLLRSSGTVRRAGAASASGMGFRMSGESTSMPSSVRRVFVRGCE